LLSVLSTQSLSSLSSTSSSHTMSSLDLSKALLMQHFFWHIVLRRNASPIQRINLMAHPLLAFKRLWGMFKDLAFIASSRSKIITHKQSSLASLLKNCEDSS
jgi:hypothetical protein